MDQNGLLMLIKMIQLLIYLNDEASQTYKDMAVSFVSAHESNMDFPFDQHVDTNMTTAKLGAQSFVGHNWQSSFMFGESPT